MSDSALLASAVPTAKAGGPPLRVFVHLARGFDVRRWEERWRTGKLIGINDPSPYGYARAKQQGCVVAFSQDDPESAPVKLVRLTLRAVLGFDIVHAWRNREGIYASDVVWTHTESQHLAVAALFSLVSQPTRPRLIGQSVWLFDRWRKLSGLRRRFFRVLMRKVDILTVHSESNLAVARRLFPNGRCELVPFGIPAEEKRPPILRKYNPVQVLCLGNDRHRDWETAVAALAGRPGILLTILSATADQRLAAKGDNIRIETVRTNEELLARFSAATLMLVPLKPNLHVSGITVMQEAALQGLPIVATDVGGLRSYFDPDMVAYVPPGDPEAIYRAVELLRADPIAAQRMAQRAQDRMGGGISVDNYIRQHVQLSKEMLVR